MEGRCMKEVNVNNVNIIETSDIKISDASIRRIEF